MKIHDLSSEEGRVFAFEVGNLFLGRRLFCRLVSGIPGARLLRTPRIFTRGGEDEFCEFEIEGVTFVGWEPWGDNSRYWVGPKPPRWVPQLTTVREAFSRARPI